MTERAKKIHSYFTDQKDEFLELLRTLVEQETPSDDPESISAIFSIISKEFENIDFEVTHFTGNETGGQLLCKPSGFSTQKSCQLIIGHCDTVWDKGTIEEMPFEIENNHVSGPGVYDMKTGICMMIFSLRAIADLDEQLVVQPVFLINSDEEIGSEESSELIVQEAKKS